VTPTSTATTAEATASEICARDSYYEDDYEILWVEEHEIRADDEILE
jgi:hypothetical protein